MSPPLWCGPLRGWWARVAMRQEGTGVPRPEFAEPILGPGQLRERTTRIWQAQARNNRIFICTPLPVRARPGPPRLSSASPDDRALPFELGRSRLPRGTVAAPVGPARRSTPPIRSDSRPERTLATRLKLNSSAA